MKPNMANCGGCESTWEGKDKGKETAPVGSFPENPFGLYDTAGNVWEWTCSVYEENYEGAEQKCVSKDHADPRVLRGGSWDYGRHGVRAANRDRDAPATRYGDGGFRLARQF
jgi:formylglycine-generating enzyme required for sulfatase activity